MKSIYVFLCLVLSAPLSAQQKFIEVNVSDTALVQADLFVYRIGFSYDPYDDYDDTRYKNPTAYEKKKQQEQKKNKSLFDSITNVVKSHNFSILPTSLSQQFYLDRTEHPYYSNDVILYSSDSLSLLYNLIVNVKGMHGMLVLSQAKDEALYQQYLYSKLIKKAKLKANNIATYADQKITGILSIAENKQEEQSTGWTAYPPLSSLGDNRNLGWKVRLYTGNDVETISNNKTGMYPIEASLTVRFTVE